MNNARSPIKTRLLDKLIFIPVIISLIAVWGFFIKSSVIERNGTLRQARSNLELTVETLADYSEISKNHNSTDSNSLRTASLWRALLAYPTAKIWEESSENDAEKNKLKMDQRYILVKATRNNIVYYAALPKDSVLEQWVKNSIYRSFVLVAISIAFLLLTHLLARTFRQSFKIEQEIAETNLRLESELAQRISIEKALKEHDVLLNIITKSTTELLQTKNIKSTIDKILTSVGETVNVKKIQLVELLDQANNKYHLFNEWPYRQAAPASLNDIDIESLSLQNHSDRTPTKASVVTLQPSGSLLILPIFCTNILWGHLTFLDISHPTKEWSWAETDTLHTLSSLIGVAISQAQYVNELADAHRKAGMSEIATNILHNVGNVLNSINVSTDIIANGLRQINTGDLQKALALAKEIHLGESAQENPKAKNILAYLYTWYDFFIPAHDKNIDEMKVLKKSLEHIREIISRQQVYTGDFTIEESLELENVIDDSLRMSLTQDFNYTLEKSIPRLPAIMIDKHKLLQILINVITNAKHALIAGNPSEKKLSVAVHRQDKEIIISITDNGIGIVSEHLDLIFGQGFTTKQRGHGFGLHNSALLAKELGGKLSVSSTGLGFGATFTLQLPLKISG